MHSGNISLPLYERFNSTAGDTAFIRSPSDINLQILTPSPFLAASVNLVYSSVIIIPTFTAIPYVLPAARKWLASHTGLTFSKMKTFLDYAEKMSLDKGALVQTNSTVIVGVLILLTLNAASGKAGISQISFVTASIVFPFVFGRRRHHNGTLFQINGKTIKCELDSGWASDISIPPKHCSQPWSDRDNSNICRWNAKILAPHYYSRKCSRATPRKQTCPI